jgi:hypothetical protein
MSASILPYWVVTWWSRTARNARFPVLETRDDGACRLLAYLKVWSEVNAVAWAERQVGFVAVESCVRMTKEPEKFVRVVFCTKRHKAIVERNQRLELMR